MSVCPCCGQQLLPTRDPVAVLAESLRRAGHSVTAAGLINESAFAAAIGRAPGTVRNWSLYGGSPIEPVRIRGRRWYSLEAVAKLLHESA